MKYHYTYRITNITLSKHYYGVRSANIDPKLDLGIKYFSSSTDKKFIEDQKINPQKYKYKIIRIFISRKRAELFETKLHKKFNVHLHESFYNKAINTNMGFSLLGIKRPKEFSDNLSQLLKGVSYEERYGKEKAKEIKEKLKGRKRTKETIEKIKSSRKNQKFSKDTRSKMSKNNSGSKNSKAKLIHIFDRDHVLKFVCNGDFVKICHENNLPTRVLQKSYQSNGTLIYQTKSKSNIKKLENNGNIKYIGWYAKEIK